MVMLGSADNASQWGRQVAQPDEIGMRETQSPCVIVADADAHYAQAKAAGATIVMDIADQDYGGRGYACRDIEGHLWWFGSSDPWKTHDCRSVSRDAAADGRRRYPLRHRRLDARALDQQPLPHRPGTAAPQGGRQPQRQK